jgi:hypothetical protein
MELLIRLHSYLNNITFTDELTACRDSGFHAWIGLNPEIRPPSVEHRREMRGKVEKRKCPFVNSLRLQRAVDIVFTMPRSAIPGGVDSRIFCAHMANSYL